MYLSMVDVLHQDTLCTISVTLGELVEVGIATEGERSDQGRETENTCAYRSYRQHGTF